MIVGTGAVGRLVARKILAHKEYGLNLVGFVDANPTTSNGEIGTVPVLGAPERLRALVAALDIERVIVSFTENGHEETLKLVRTLRDDDVQIDIVPRLYEAVGTNAAVHMIEGMPLVGLPPLRLSPSSQLLKRSLDLVGALLGLLVLSPVLLAAAIAIKIDSRGPVLFSQVRSGERGRSFRIYKFRTMCLNAESRKAEVAELNMHKHDDPRMFKVPDDPRVTRVGRFLRRSSIDELPQLFNVVKGEMSLVGPRPLILEEDAQVQDWARKRVELRPALRACGRSSGAATSRSAR